MSNRRINTTLFRRGALAAVLSALPAGAGSAGAAGALPATNAADTVEAVQAMTVEENTALEAEEVAEAMRHVEGEKKKPVEKEIDPWDRFAPPLDPDHDWLQLNSGEWLKGDFKVLYDYSMRVLNEDNGKYTHHMVGTMSFELIGGLDLDVSVIWDRIEKPQLDDNGELPDQDDYQLIMGLAYDF